MPSFPLPPGGMDIFYIDESAGDGIFVAASVRAPLLRQQDSEWSVVWPEYHELAIEWRRSLSRDHNIRFRHELHASQVLSGHGRLHKSGRILNKTEAVELYRTALQRLDFLPAASILISSATKASTLFGEVKMQAALLALFQRMESQTRAQRTAAMTFFDEGHREYTQLYRKSQAYLPVGSARGGWEDGASKSRPLGRFVEDGNTKSSADSLLVQVADLVAYAALAKLKGEAGLLSARRIDLGHNRLFDEIPRQVINLAATRKRSDGIVVV